MYSFVPGSTASIMKCSVKSFGVWSAALPDENAANVAKAAAVSNVTIRAL
jgi:hypothetical protein